MGRPPYDANAPEVVQQTVGAGATVQATRWKERLGGHERRVQWLHGVPARSTFDAIEVPAGQYLMLGDNRDDSADSRYIGLVPRNLLIGQARRVLVSADILGRWAPRLQRIGLPL